MRAFTWIAFAFVLFHAPDGSMVAVDIADGQVIVRPSPPGYLGNTMIETGSGTAVVQETPCEVLHALDRTCKDTGKIIRPLVPAK